KNVIQVNLEGFWDRLREAFDGKDLSTGGEIEGVWRLDVMEEWAKNNDYPPMTVLMSISRLSHTSLYWLLTGRGKKHEEEYFKAQPSFINAIIADYEALNPQWTPIIRRPSYTDSNNSEEETPI